MFYASLATTALSTGLNYYAQSEQADAQNEYKEQMQEQNRENAMESYRQQTAQQQTRLVQEETSIAQQEQQRSKQQRKAAGEALASSQSAGVNLDALMSDYLRAEGSYRSALQQNMDWTRNQAQQNMKGMQAQARDRIASGNFAPTQGPSGAAALAGLGTKAMSSFQSYNKSMNKANNNNNSQ
jgi:hypothetical protein